MSLNKATWTISNQIFYRIYAKLYTYFTISPNCNSQLESDQSAN